jgi:hypothetical protein
MVFAPTLFDGFFFPTVLGRVVGESVTAAVPPLEAVGFVSPSNFNV